MKASGHLLDIPRTEYPAIWCVLNRQEWHPSLKDKPSNYDTMTRQALHDFRWGIMQEILRVVGLKACLREWNRETMTDDEFEDFWKRNHYARRS